MDGKAQTDDQKPPSTEKEDNEQIRKNKIYYYFKENEKKFSQAKGIINPDVTYNLFFDGGSSGNPGQVNFLKSLTILFKKQLFGFYQYWTGSFRICDLCW